ncbi:hypothetical protein COV93_02885 [Candidatus Woesearchaeota archaeon CG11_big_fil_rev_8_21_14_0_20_43_8]|nr:MAG: hypothetical protein COV93_02885 [Candidatus Woesearchaeota archaeon CG11_big_fil_rev_8_21_14_0_20_43_8]
MESNLADIVRKNCAGVFSMPALSGIVPCPQFGIDVEGSGLLYALTERPMEKTQETEIAVEHYPLKLKHLVKKPSRDMSKERTKLFTDRFKKKFGAASCLRTNNPYYPALIGPIETMNSVMKYIKSDQSALFTFFTNIFYCEEKNRCRIIRYFKSHDSDSFVGIIQNQSRSDINNYWITEFTNGRYGYDQVHIKDMVMRPRKVILRKK